jgi:hypothetical protein
MLMVESELFAETLVYLNPYVLVSLDHTVVKAFKGQDGILKFKLQSLEFLLSRVGCIEKHKVKI